MSSHSAKIDQIKQMLETENNYRDILEAFLELVENEFNFLDVFDEYVNNMLIKVLGAVGYGIFNANCDVDQLRLIIDSNSEFIHGTCMINGNMTVILYCPDIEIGVVAVTLTSFPDQVHYARFTATFSEDGDAASIDHSAGRTLH